MRMYFKFEELVGSPTAERMGIKNVPGTAEMINVCRMIQTLNKLRSCFYSSPIRVTSGYRCEELNQAVGGAKNSWHKTGLAVDVQPWVMEEGDKSERLDKLASSIMAMAFDKRFPITRLIMEKQSAGDKRWVHFEIPEQDIRGNFMEEVEVPEVMVIIDGIKRGYMVGNTTGWVKQFEVMRKEWLR